MAKKKEVVEGEVKLPSKIDPSFYEVKIRFMTPLLGTKPDKDVFSKYLAKLAEDEGVHKNLILEELDTLPDDKELGTEERGTTRFNRELGKGIFIYDYMVKGFLKHASTVLSSQVGVLSAKSKAQNYVFTGPRRIFLTDDEGKIKEKADGDLMIRPKLVDSTHGKQSVVGVSEKVTNGSATFRIMLLKNKPTTSSRAYTVDTLEEILSYGFLQGLGQWRNGGYGSFMVESFEKVEMSLKDWPKYCYPNGREMDDNTEG